MGTAVLLAGYVGVLVAYENVQQGRLSSAWTHDHPPGSVTDATFAPPGTTPAALLVHAHLVDGEPVARLLVPSIGYSAIVTEGVDSGWLSGGPGHDERTGYPGEGRIILIGNHNGFSFSWDGIQPQAEVVLETYWGARYHYRVVRRQIVDGDDTAVLSRATHSGEELVLSTCWPLWAGALARQRLVFEALPVTGQG
jgi:LPXTG-site transpeptidase (sortase) family protein